MASSGPAATTLDRDFLGIRCRLIDLAAALDRIDRTSDTATDDRRLAQIHEGLAILQTAEPGRAERIQMLLSLPMEDRD
jgi:hypothetical protein